MFRINIISQLIIFLVFAFMLTFWHLIPLLSLFFILLIALMWNGYHHFYHSMKKLKWFYFVMLLIYIFNTPGEHIANWPLNSFYPTYEGLREGVVQVLRIAVMLAALSLLIASNTKQTLISGFYYLARPLKIIGLDAERFAARLWLTLHYVELRQLKKGSEGVRGTLLQNLNEAFTATVDDDVKINFEKPVLKKMDYFLLVLTLILMSYFLGFFR